MKRVPVLVQLAGLSLVTAFAVAGCSGDDGPSIVVYNAQHEQLLEEIAPKFTEETGIEVELRNGSDPELAAQLVAGGRRLARRRVPHRELPGDVGGRAGRALRPARRRDARADPGAVPSRRAVSGPASWPAPPCWSTTPSMVDEAELPDSIMDLADPEWAGTDLVLARPAPTSRRSWPRCSTSRARRPPSAWLDGLKANGTVYDGNNVVLESVNAGESAIGIDLPLLLVPRPGRVRRQQRQHRAVLLRQPGPRARSSASPARACSPSSDNPEEAAAVRRVPDQRGGPAGPRRQLRAGVPAQPRRQPGPARQAALASSSPRPSTISDLDGDKVVEMMTEAGFL